MNRIIYEMNKIFGHYLTSFEYYIGTFLSDLYTKNEPRVYFRNVCLVFTLIDNVIV